MANNVYGAIGLIGNTAGTLDYIDGAGLADGDIAIVAVKNSNSYIYVLDANSGAAESSPLIIRPENNYGNKRWILVPMIAAMYG